MLALFDDEGRRRLLDAEAALLRGGATVAIDLQARRGDGSMADFTVIMKADRGPGGAIRGFVGTIQDITRRKEPSATWSGWPIRRAVGLGNRSLFQRG